jgi:serine-type D-Ala-D-Ala carboxypeptidase/endopeptidase (penicillin-binding protein 4)
VSDITSTRRRTVLTWLAAGSAALAGAAAVVMLLGLTVLRGAPVLNQIPAFADDPDERAVVAPLAVRVPGTVLPSPAAELLPSAGSGAPAPAVAALERQLAPLVSATALGPSVSADVVDPLTGQHLLSRSQAAPRTPASTAKLLTGAAAISVLGAQSTLPTTVLSTPGSGGRPQLSLVGGGDVLLGGGDSAAGAVNGRAGLGTLAVQTAAALAAQGQTTVGLSLDDSLFGDQSLSPKWSASDVAGGYVAPVMAIEVNAGRLTTDEYARRASDPALAAATAFADGLTERGITVRGAIRRAAAPPGATQLAQVQSATIAQQVEYALTQSDNTVAEALARLVALRAGQPATFAAGGQAVLDQVAALGVGVQGAVLTDGSGLGDGSAVPAAALTQVLVLAASQQQPELRSLLSGLPIAAVSGTLADRFASSSQKPARGVVRAKTGTLRGVSSLAGTAVDADGRLLVFAVLADQVPNTLAARKALDDIASTLAGCGCQ